MKHKWFIWILIITLGTNMIMIPGVHAESTAPSVPTTTQEDGSYLTIDGQPNSVIMLPYSASEKEAYAAQELQKHIKLVSEADVPIVRGELDTPTIDMTLSTTEISVTKVGYYPFTIMVSNTTDSSALITLAFTATEGSPKVEIQGQDGLATGQLEVESNSVATVQGLVTVDETTNYGTSPITIEMSSNSTPISNQVITVDYIEPNLLQNPGLENTSFRPWYQKTGFYADSTGAHSGSKSMKLSGTNGMRGGYDVRLPVQSGYAYELSFWAKTNSVSPADIKMIFTENDENSDILVIRVTEETFALTEEWKEYRIEFFINPSLNPDFDYAWWFVELVRDGTVWADDFVLKELGEIEGYVVPEDPLPNIVRNGSFEEDSAWTYQAGSSKIKYDDAIDGDYVLFIDLAEKEIDANHPYQNSLAVKKNHIYTVGFDAKKGGENPNGSIRFDLTPTPTKQGLPLVEMKVTPTIEWMRYEMSFVSPSDEIFTERYWPDFFVPGSSGYLYVDNITLNDLGEATETVDSSIISKPSVKPLPDGVGNGTIVPPALGEKPELMPPTLQTLSDEVLIIYLATSDSYPALEQQYKEDIDFIGDSDGFAVRLNGNTVYIFGTNADGTLNGVYDFIESNLGVLWTRSTDIGTLYDPLPSIELVHHDYNEKSPFKIRGWNLIGMGAGGEVTSDPGTEIMMSRNKLSTKYASYASLQYWDWQKSIGLEPFTLGHSLHYWLRQSPTFQALSEEEQAKYWGTDRDGNPTVGTGQLNFWNPDVADAIAESVNAFLNTNDINYIGVGIEDGSARGQKPEDEQPFEYAPGEFVEPDDPKYLSTVYFSFINNVAQLVGAEHPDVTLTTWAYNFTQTPPYGEVEDNIFIVFAPESEDMKLPLTDPSSPKNTSIIKNMLEWPEKTDNIIVYNYYGCFPNASDDFDRPIASRIQSDLRFYVDQGIIGMIPEGLVDANNDMWAISTLTMWLYSKLAWNPEADIQELTELFCEKAYGIASKHMLEYYQLLNETWDKNYVYLKWNVPTSTYVKTFYGDSEHNAKMQVTLDQAWGAANDLQKQRIAPIKEAFERNTDEGYQFNEEAVAKKTNAGSEAILEALNMDNPIWAEAPVLEDFRDANTMLPVDGVETKVRLLWDEDNLYIAYENFDSGISDLAKAELNPEGNWWSGLSDDVETYLSKENPKENTGEAYKTYFGNPLGEQIVYRNGPVFIPEPGEWYTSAAIFDEDGEENDRWVIIQAIPFEQLGIDGPTLDTDLYGYFYRGHYAPSLINIGWGSAGVWSSAHFNRITLSDDTSVTLESIVITNEPDKTEYTKGDDLDLTGLLVTGVYSDSSEVEVTEYEVSGYDEDTLGEQTITVTYEGKTATFTVIVNSFLPSLDMSFASEYVSLSGNAKITGDLGTNSIIADSIDFSGSTGIDGNLFIGPGADCNEVISSPKADPRSHITGEIANLKSIREYSLPKFSAIPELEPKGDLVAKKNQSNSHVIDESSAYSSITVNDQLTVNVGDEDIALVTNTLSIKGNGSIIVNRTGTGRLILYVLDKLEVNGNGSINKDGDYNNLIIYYAGSNALNFKGNTKICGSIFAEDTDAEISGNAEVTGHFISGGNNVAITGNAANVGAVYAPNANLKMSGNSKIKSIAIARSIELSGSASIIQDSSIGFDFLEQLEW